MKIILTLIAAVICGFSNLSAQAFDPANVHTVKFVSNLTNFVTPVSPIGGQGGNGYQLLQSDITNMVRFDDQDSIPFGATILSVEVVYTSIYGNLPHNYSGTAPFRYFTANWNGASDYNHVYGNGSQELIDGTFADSTSSDGKNLYFKDGALITNLQMVVNGERPDHGFNFGDLGLAPAPGQQTQYLHSSFYAGDFAPYEIVTYAVPEPTTWASIVFGGSVIGFIFKRK